MDKLLIELSNDQLVELSLLIASNINQQKKQKDNFVNKKELCSILKVSNNTLSKWIDQGLPIIKIERTTRFSVNDVLQWLNTR